jgi:CheY-like chemotaxis protein
MPEIAINSFDAPETVNRNHDKSRRDQAESKDAKPIRPRILVVDDEKLITDTMTEILEGAGFLVAAAYDGWSALDLASRFQPDYLLSDVLMPKMNGVELAIAIRNMYPAVRILLFSGQAGISEILQSGQRQGFQFELIPKPIHPTRLIERLNSL